MVNTTTPATTSSIGRPTAAATTAMMRLLLRGRGTIGGDTIMAETVEPATRSPPPGRLMLLFASPTAKAPALKPRSPLYRTQRIGIGSIRKQGTDAGFKTVAHGRCCCARCWARRCDGRAWSRAVRWPTWRVAREDFACPTCPRWSVASRRSRPRSWPRCVTALGIDLSDLLTAVVLHLPAMRPCRSVGRAAAVATVPVRLAPPRARARRRLRPGRLIRLRHRQPCGPS